MFLFGVTLALPRRLFGLTALLPLNEWVVWYSGVPTMAGVVLALADLFLLLPSQAPDSGCPRSIQSPTLRDGCPDRVQ